MHEQLTKQLIEQFGSLDAVPQELKGFLETIDGLYESADQTEKELHDTEVKFRTLLENSSDVISLIDENGLIQYQSPSIERIYGYTPSELIGTELLDIIHPEDKNKAKYSFIKSLKNPGEYITFEFRALIKSGEYRDIEAIGVNTLNEEGVGTVYISSRDVTEQKQLGAEKQRRSQHRSQQISITEEFSQTIANVQDIGELYRKTVKTIKEKLNVDYVQLLRYNQTTDNLVLVSGTGDIGTQLLNSQYQIQIHHGTIGKAAGNRSSVLVTDTTIEPGWTATPNLPNIKSQLATPIMLGSNLLGVIDVQSEITNFVNEDTQLVLGVLSNLIAISFESIRLRTEMEERLRELDALQRITVKEGWESHKDISSIAHNAYTFDRSTGQATPIDGFSGHDLLSHELSVRGEVIGALAIQNDPERPISDEEKDLLESIAEEVAKALERARLFESSQRSAAELTILNEMGNAFTEAMDPDAIIQNIYNFSSRLIETDDFYVAIYDNEKDLITFPLVIEDGNPLPADHPHWENYQSHTLASGGGLTRHILKSRASVLIDKNAEEVLEKLGIPFERDGDLTQSWLGVPMAVGDRVVGVICCQSNETAGLYNPHHQELLTTIASQAAIAIDNAQRFQEEQSRAAQERLVRTITDQVRRGADIEAIMRIALEQLSGALGAEKSVIHLGTREQLLKNIQASQAAPNGNSQDPPDEKSQDVETIETEHSKPEEN